MLIRFRLRLKLNYKYLHPTARIWVMAFLEAKSAAYRAIVIYLSGLLANLEVLGLRTFCLRSVLLESR